ncbi:helix-turn-helix domain-containing protein [Spongiactinospora sp. TRM90649]|uniref:helix-turn-helix domain-containing protein n=1 Tax=Spongiactinospora sp. TRM90649 TaxID=3031114 RepID=UPI0023F8C970|nr:helix-turn-helix domain-containing protein [Spongiactinospora sp. TRM90649]MDF5756712.1 helix-turn-helix domain-containing protein [Spongiactinospora sp. TRM90649]
MGSTVLERDVGVAWDVASSVRRSGVSGVTMAGFRDDGTAAEGHRLIPHPAVTLVLDLGAGSPVVEDAAGRRHRGSLVAGLGLGGAVWVRGQDIECVQVRLSPVVARAILGAAPAELDGRVVRLEDLWGGQASRLGERLGEVSSWEDRFALIEAAFARRREAGPQVEPEVAWAWRRIVAGRGLVRVERLAAELGWSRKRLWSRFHTQIGLPPKRAAKLVRFDRAVHRLAAWHDAAGVAADCGYTDQSHLHRDVMEFAGVTPAAVAREPFLAADDVAWPGRAVTR